MNCDGVLELVARGREQDPAVASHLAVCPSCRLESERAAALGRHLRDPLLWETPPPEMEERVVTAVAQEGRARRRRRPWWMAAGAAAAVLAVTFAAIGWQGRPDWTVELDGVRSAATARAVVAGWNQPEGTRMVLEVDGLEAASPDAYYEVWLTAPDGRHISAGTFRTGGRVQLTVGVRRSDYPRIWITREPADFDPSPFPDTVLDTPGF